MNIALPEGLKDYVRRRVAEGGYGSVSEYVRELIRADMDRSAWATIEAEVARGLASGPARAMTAEDWRALRRRIPRDQAD